jgi:hypothetical protein
MSDIVTYIVTFVAELAAALRGGGRVRTDQRAASTDADGSPDAEPRPGGRPR